MMFYEILDKLELFAPMLLKEGVLTGKPEHMQQLMHYRDPYLVRRHLIQQYRVESHVSMHDTFNYLKLSVRDNICCTVGCQPSMYLIDAIDPHRGRIAH